MRILMVIIGSLLLLAVAVFSLFGFFATFEPSDTPRVFFVFRIIYALVGLSCVAGIIALIRKSLRR